MRPDERDRTLLEDMRTSAQNAIEFIAGMSFDQYTTDLKTRRAVERAIEIIGEAARGVSEAFKIANPEVPWRPITAQRHILAHEYGEIQEELIWRVVVNHLPPLIAQLDAMLAAD